MKLKTTLRKCFTFAIMSWKSHITNRIIIKQFAFVHHLSPTLHFFFFSQFLFLFSKILYSVELFFFSFSILIFTAFRIECYIALRHATCSRVSVSLHCFRYYKNSQQKHKHKHRYTERERETRSETQRNIVLSDMKYLPLNVVLLYKIFQIESNKSQKLLYSSV